MSSDLDEISSISTRLGNFKKKGEQKTFALEGETYSLGRDLNNSRVLYGALISRLLPTILRLSVPESERYFFGLLMAVSTAKKVNGITISGKKCLNRNINC
ncbi:hypothetical protein [Myxosarcina sp. GI1(2024)]